MAIQESSWDSCLFSRLLENEMRTEQEVRWEVWLTALLKSLSAFRDEKYVILLIPLMLLDFGNSHESFNAFFCHCFLEDDEISLIYFTHTYKYTFFSSTESHRFLTHFGPFLINDSTDSCIHILTYNVFLYTLICTRIKLVGTHAQ